MIRQNFLPLCLVALFSTTALGQVTLSHKIEPGSTKKVQRISRVTQTLDIAGMNTETSAETIATVSLTAGPAQADGTQRVEEKVDSLQVAIKAAGSEYLFDSANPDKTGSSPLEIVRDVHKAIANGKTTIVFGEGGRVVSVENDQNVLASLPEQVRALVQSQLDPDQLKQTANQALGILPGQPVKPGDTWDRTEAANFGAGQVMTFGTRYTYEGTVEQGGKTLDKITASTTSVDFSLANDSPLPVAVKGSELEAAESATTILFDREAGQVVESKGLVRITGTIDFEANGTPLPSKLDLKIETEVTLQP